MSARHTLRPHVGTVHRGVFDATLPPVLTVASGDVVEVTTLSGNADQIPPAESGFTVFPEHRDVLERLTDALLRVETLEGAMLERVFRGEPQRSAEVHHEPAA